MKMKREHSDDDTNGGTASESDIENASTSRALDKSGRRTSRAWQYFDIINEDKFLARCSLCSIVMSFRSSVSNLVKHAKMKHPFAYKQIHGESPKGMKRKPSKNIRSKNRKPVNNDTDEDELKSIFVSSDGKVFELETDNGVEFPHIEEMNNENEEIIFEQLNSPPSSKRHKRFKRPYMYDKGSKARPSLKHENITVQPTETLDSLEHLTRYLVSILRDLPKAVSSELQLKFVQLALEAQVKHDSDKTTVNVNNDSTSEVTEERQ